MTHEWRPLGFRRTIQFLFRDQNAVASWRHFGWEIEIEKTGRKTTYITFWRMNEH